MAGAPPPYPPQYPPTQGDWRFQRRAMREQARAQRDLSRAQWKMYRDQQRAQMRATQGGSVLGPVLLIALGIVFLLVQTGRLGYGALGLWYGRWWPLLLLGGGIVMILEWAFARREGGGGRRRVGGGFTVLLLLLCVPGMILNVAHASMGDFPHGLSVNEDNLDEFLGDRHESDDTIDQPIAEEGAKLSINNPHGDVTLDGTSTDGRIHVAVHKQVFSRSDTDAAGKERQMVPVLMSTADGMTLNVGAVEGGHADLTVTVPRTTSVTVTADHGTVHLGSLRAPVKVTANHGQVELDEIVGAVAIHVNNRNTSVEARQITGAVTLQGNCGDVNLADVTGTVSLDGDFFGKTHFEHVSGALRFHTSRTDFQASRLDGEVDLKRGELTGDQMVGPVSLTARSYNVSLERVAGDVSVTTSDGTVDITSAPPLGNITIQDRNGAVNLTLPEHAVFAVQAATRDGDIQTDFPLQQSEDNDTKRLVGAVGTGGPLIRVDTTQNDISLKKGVIAPLLPPPPPVPPITFHRPSPASPSHP